MIKIIHNGRQTNYWYDGAAQKKADELVEAGDYDFEFLGDGKSHFVRRKTPQDFLDYMNTKHGDNHPQTCSCVQCERARNIK